MNPDADPWTWYCERGTILPGTQSDIALELADRNGGGR